MSENIVEVKNLVKTYEKGKVKALNSINFTIQKGEFVSIIGPSGSGKSTLLHMLGALDIPDSGEIIIDGENIQKSKKLNKFRSNKVGFIFQLHNLIPNLSAVENVEIPMYTQKISNKEQRQKALDLLDDVGLKDKSKMKPNQLSGGERQRVAIARSFANDPKIILADEPTGSLDSKNSTKILENNEDSLLHNEIKI